MKQYFLEIFLLQALFFFFRYFATGSSFQALSYYFLRGHTTVRKIVYETSTAIWTVLQPEYLPKPSRQLWLKTASRYWELWNLPNCCGSIDGKHIRIKAPPKSGSAYFNYKGYFSIVLLAVADADGLLLSVDIGEYGRNSDGRAFKESAFGKAVVSDQLDLPEPKPLPGENDNASFPYYFVADEAFPLSDRVMKPYPRRQLTNDKRIFNYRLSRGRRSIECAFGLLTSKFRVLETPICCNIDKIDSIIQAICVLHNFIRVHDGVFTNPTFQLKEHIIANNNPIQPGRHRRPTNGALELRNRLCNFFNQPTGALPWQNDHCVL